MFRQIFLSSPLAVFQKVGGAPEIKGGGGAVWTPAFAKFFELFGFWKLALFVGDLKAASDAKVVHRKNVGAAEIENKEHFGSPTTNAGDFGERFQQFLVGEIVASFKSRYVAGSGVFGDFKNVADFGTGESGAAQSLEGGG